LTLPRFFARLRKRMSSPSVASRARPAPARSARWWGIGLAKASVALAIVYAPLGWFSGHYRIVYDSIKGANCLPYSVFLVDLRDHATDRGAYIAFVTRQMEPFYANGTLAVKQIAAVPGDRVQVGAEGVAINGRLQGALLHLRKGERLWRMGRRIVDVERDELVPQGHLWMMGTNPRSYDSRYWGYIENEQIVGRAIPLW
jgi:conjugal transfer pilin signal peptidase TrbI